MRKRIFSIAGIIGLVLIVAAAVAWRLLRVSELARIGTGYAAQQTCACLFISRRAPESCHLDLEPMARWMISVKIGTGEVTGRVFGVARARAVYEPGFGCSLKE